MAPTRASSKWLPVTAAVLVLLFSCAAGQERSLLQATGQAATPGPAAGGTLVPPAAPAAGAAPAPVTPTPAPVTPTPAPVTPTPAPVTPTPAPVTPTPAPVTPIPAPVMPTPVPTPTPTPDPAVQPTPVGTPAPADTAAQTGAGVTGTDLPAPAPGGAPVDTTGGGTAVGTPADPLLGATDPTATGAPTVPATVGAPPAVLGEQDLANAPPGATDGLTDPTVVVEPTQGDDYMGPATALAYGNFTVLPPLPATVTVPAQASRLVTWNPEILATNKALYDAAKSRNSGNSWILDAVEALSTRANEVIAIEPIWRCTNKTQGAASGIARDYLSLAEFYWPQFVSEVNPEGLPYAFQAGRNPDVFDIAPNYFMLWNTFEDVHDLALAYYFTGKQKYSLRAVEKIYMWFLNPTESMLPNLEYASIIRGVTSTGRPQGVYDMNEVGKLLNAVALLEGSPQWTPEYAAGLQQWFTDYSNWMTTSPNGILERQQVNYHGNGYDAQLAQIYMFLGKTTEAAQIIYYGKERMPNQIINAVMVYERDRQRSLDFIQECLTNWVTLAHIGDKLGVPIWDYGLMEGHAFKATFDYMRPYWETLGVSWPYQQVGVNRVRLAAKLVPFMYMGYKAPGVPNSGPREYVSLYTTMFPSFDTVAQEAEAVISRLTAVPLDSLFARDGIPLIEVCRSIFCQTETLIIFGLTLLSLFAVTLCLCWNRHMHAKANRAVELPAYLLKIQEQQQKLQDAGLRVVPAKPSFMEHVLKNAERDAIVEEAAAAKVQSEREVKQQIKAIEKQKKVKKEERESRMQASQMGGGGYQPSYAGSASSMYQGQGGAPGMQFPMGSHMTPQPHMSPYMAPQPGYHQAGSGFQQQPHMGSGFQQQPHMGSGFQQQQQQQPGGFPQGPGGFQQGSGFGPGTEGQYPQANAGFQQGSGFGPNGEGQGYGQGSMGAGQQQWPQQPQQQPMGAAYPLGGGSQAGHDSSFVMHPEGPAPLVQGGAPKAAPPAVQAGDQDFSFPNSNKDAVDQPPTPVSSRGSFRGPTADPASPLSQQLSVGNSTSAPSGSISTLLANAHGLLAEYDEGDTTDISRKLNTTGL